MSAAAFEPAAHLPALQVVVPLFGALVCAVLRQRHACIATTIVVTVATLAIAFGIMARVGDEGTLSYALGGFAHSARPRPAKL